ncbi:glycosyltransferase family 4 protein [Flavobacterium sp. WC2509]|uniref:glycosyltransferase family 4 protein n=1 Tax=Flavobacterium sp. WC2509 TaxID=3461406 RepID=UPI004044D8AC
MKIFFDFYEIALNKGKSIGIYNYSLSILKTLAKENDGNIEIVVACSGENLDEIKEIANIKLKIVSIEYPNFKKRLLWRLVNAIRLAKKQNADIYFSPKGFAPSLFKRKKKPFIVLTVHDMIPFYYLSNYPNYFSFFENHFITQSLKHSLTVANKIITISEFSKQMIYQHHERREDIYVVYNGVSIFTKNIESKKISPYIFAITSKLPHKNMINLLKGYTKYRELVTNPLPLVVCGIRDYELVGFEEFKPFIECVHFADENKFTTLFSNATLFLFLPKIEGFGFPPLESLMYGVPNIVSDIPVLREVLGDSAYFVDAENPEKIANSIISVLSNPIVGQNILASGKKTILNYSWEKCCDQILKIFETINKNND